MYDLAVGAQVMFILGPPASAMLGIGIWALRRDSRALIQAVAILLIALGAALGLFTMATVVFGGEFRYI